MFIDLILFAVCSFIPFFLNGDVVSNGSVISYTCTTGYTLNGATWRTCQDDGNGWSLVEPICGMITLRVKVL